jgi:hypothetical protein
LGTAIDFKARFEGLSFARLGDARAHRNGSVTAGAGGHTARALRVPAHALVTAHGASRATRITVAGVTIAGVTIAGVTIAGVAVARIAVARIAVARIAVARIAVARIAVARIAVAVPHFHLVEVRRSVRRAGADRGNASAHQAPDQAFLGKGPSHPSLVHSYLPFRAMPSIRYPSSLGEPQGTR